LGWHGSVRTARIEERDGGVSDQFIDAGFMAVIGVLINRPAAQAKNPSFDVGVLESDEQWPCSHFVRAGRLA
jgi:hypothetical protein